MQGASVDPSGRLRVVNQTPSTGYQNRANEGFTFEPDGRLNVGSAFLVTVANAGLQASNQGRMKFSPAPVSAAFYNKGWPLNVDGSTLMYIDQPVPHDTPFNAGIAMDDRGVYATTTPAPPAPTTRFDLTQFPLDPRITITRNGVGTYWDANGVLKTAAINEPRPYRNPAGGAILGLMIEEAATNKVLWSSDFANTAWTKFGGATINSNVATAPDGNMTADRLNFAGIGGIYQSPAAINGETNFNSIFIRADVAGNVRLVANTQLSDPASVVCPVTTEWKRFSLSKLMATGSLNCTCQVDNNTAGALSSVYIWGADQCAEQILSSHIETGASQVTRQFDKAIIDPTSWWNPVEGTLACKAVIDYSPRIAGISNLMWSADQVGGAFGAGCYGTFQSNTGIGLAPGAAPVNMTSTVNDGVSTAAILAVGLKANDSIAAVNGVLGAADLACAMPIGVNQLAIGQVGWGTLAGNSCINGYVSYIDYWNTRLPNNQLLELTGPAAPVTPVIPVNTVAPAITGIPSSSNTLTCSTGTWTGAVNYTYRWLQNNTPLIGQNRNTLVLNSAVAPIGSKIKCQVTAISSTGDIATAQSNEVTVV